jgi:hypothetical protein
VERIRHTLACLAAGFVLGLAATAQASADEYDAVFHDAVIGGPVPSTKAATASASSAPSYPVLGGQTVNVQVDPVFAGTDALQRVLDTLGATVHGAEMSNLNVHIADSVSLPQICGQNSTACYFPASMTMVVSGQPTNPNNQMPQGMVITHEYGHHIEANRSFPGWYATDMGGRHWATYEHVCEGVASGALFPGDQGAHYWENPGEAFAQAYATMHYPNAVPWWWSFANPDAGAFDAIRADVADTSHGTSASWSQKLNAAKPSATITINTSLDGPIDVTLRQPKGASYNLQLLSASGEVLGRGQVNNSVKWKGAKSKKKGKKGKKARGKPGQVTLNYGTCGARSFQLQVTRRSGRGPFTAQIVRP